VSNYHRIRCKECGEEERCRLNWGGNELASLIQQRKLIEQCAEIECFALDIQLTGQAVVDKGFFVTHKGHELEVVDEYGDAWSP
jgi:hypothetical protein